MCRFSIAITALSLSACASMNTWRDLEIDGTSQATINESVAAIQRELTDSRRERFDMILADLWITGRLAAEAGGSSYAESDYWADLDGLRYQDIVDLAGPESTPRYWAKVRARTQRTADGSGVAWSGTDPNRFPSYVMPPAGLVNSQ